MSLTQHIAIAAIAAVAGGAFIPAIIWFAIATNWKQLGRVMAGYRQDARFYRHWAYVGAAFGAAMATAMPLLDAYGVQDPWYGLTLMALIAATFWPMVGSLRRGRLPSER